MGGKTDWVGKEWAGLFFPRGKNGPAHSFPGEKTDLGEIPACYTGMAGNQIQVAGSFFVLFHSLRPINNVSVIKGQIFLC